MNDFGVVELASTRSTNAPGWTYVADAATAATNGATPGLGAVNGSGGGGGGGHGTVVATGAATANPKRAARAKASQLSVADQTARRDAKVRRHLEALNRDSHREIALPTRARHPGKTANVRRILQSLKTFTSHLDDYLALHDANAAVTMNATLPISGRSRTAATLPVQPVRRDSPHEAPVPRRAPKPSSEATTPSAAQTNVALLPAAAASPPLATDDPLLQSRLPKPPAEEELQALLAAPPLSYLDAWATLDESDGQTPYPNRTFCEVCGYWNRNRCIKCGTATCSLDCLTLHREECITRYGL